MESSVLLPCAPRRLAGQNAGGVSLGNGGCMCIGDGASMTRTPYRSAGAPTPPATSPFPSSPTGYLPGEVAKAHRAGRLRTD